MKPGEDGGTEPSTFFFWRRRINAQQLRKSAAAPTRPSGMPTPNPTFWLLESPALLVEGESGADVAEGSADVSASVEVDGALE